MTPEAGRFARLQQLQRAARVSAPALMTSSSPTGSPAIGAGATGVASVVTTDYVLKARSAAGIDIGAFAR